MNASFVLGILTGWLAFTDQGRKTGDKLCQSVMNYINGEKKCTQNSTKK